MFSPRSVLKLCKAPGAGEDSDPALLPARGSPRRSPLARVPVQQRSAATLEGTKSQLLAGKAAFPWEAENPGCPARNSGSGHGGHGALCREQNHRMVWAGSLKLFLLFVSLSVHSHKCQGSLMETQLFLQCTTQGAQAGCHFWVIDQLAPVCPGVCQLFTEAQAPRHLQGHWSATTPCGSRLLPSAAGEPEALGGCSHRRGGVLPPSAPTQGRPWGWGQLGRRGTGIQHRFCWRESVPGTPSTFPPRCTQ